MSDNCDLEWDLPLSALFPRKRRRISSEGKAPISKLGDDLLAEILIRLPDPKSAFSCKVVGKRWSSVISDPSFNRRFVAHHQSMNLNQPPMPDDQTELQSIILGFLPPMPSEIGAKLRVFDCFKDLVLCGFLDVDEDNSELCRSYFVCNPFTKQWMALPLAPEKSKGYKAPVSRLVCEPRSSSNCGLDIGDGQGFAYCPEYRFRVVCIYAAEHCDWPCVKLDLFCSESGTWMKEALVLPGHVKVKCKNAPAGNGELFWVYLDLDDRECFDLMLAAWNPFRLDIPPARIDIAQFLHADQWDISVSQGALHVVELEGPTVPTRSTVWRLEEDRKSWTKQCEMFLKVPPGCDYVPYLSGLPALHPNKAEILFLHCFVSEVKGDILSCDLRRGELEFFARPEVFAGRFEVSQPMRVACWPTPIPRACTMEATAIGFRAAVKHPLIIDTNAKLVDGVEQFDHRNLSTSHPRRRVKKNNVAKVSCSNKQGSRLSIRSKKGL